MSFSANQPTGDVKLRRGGCKYKLKVIIYISLLKRY